MHKKQSKLEAAKLRLRRANAELARLEAAEQRGELINVVKWHQRIEPKIRALLDRYPLSESEKARILAIFAEIKEPPTLRHD